MTLILVSAMLAGFIAGGFCKIYDTSYWTGFVAGGIAAVVVAGVILREYQK